MTRRAVVIYLMIGGAIYFAVKGAFGFGTIEDAIKELFNIAYWSAVALGFHWWENRPARL